MGSGTPRMQVGEVTVFPELWLDELRLNRRWKSSPMTRP